MIGRLFQRKPTLTGVTKIDVGCGNEKDEGYFGIDTFDGRAVDLKIDLTKSKLPFEDCSIDHAVTYHCLEHLPNYTDVVDEVWRVLKPNAQFFVCVPYFNNYINFANRYHVHHFNEHPLFLERTNDNCSSGANLEVPFRTSMGAQDLCEFAHAGRVPDLQDRDRLLPGISGIAGPAEGRTSPRPSKCCAQHLFLSSSHQARYCGHQPEGKRSDHPAQASMDDREQLVAG